MSDIKYADVIVVGGGPAGLATAFFLQRLNLDYLVIEGEEIGHSWASMPKNWRVVSPQWTNILPGSRFPYAAAYSKPLTNQYRNYLFKYANDNSINIVEREKINSVEVGSNRFLLSSDDNSYKCKVLVSATGYYSNPYTPTLLQGDDGSIKSIHVSEYLSPEKLKTSFPFCKKILIVGRRVSAGQLMTDLSKHKFSLSISARGPASPRDGSIKGRIKDVIYFPYEELKVKLNPSLHADSFPHMDGGKTEELLNEKIVDVRSNIIEVKNRHVLFDDGTNDKFDLIIFATGYKPSLSYLKDLISLDDSSGIPSTIEMQSEGIPNLFFIGLDQILNFRSRYIRGMRRDAVVLANKIKEVLNRLE